MTVTRSPLSDSWAPLAASLTAAINGEPTKEMYRIRNVSEKHIETRIFTAIENKIKIGLSRYQANV